MWSVSGTNYAYNAYEMRNLHLSDVSETAVSILEDLDTQVQDGQMVGCCYRSSPAPCSRRVLRGPAAGISLRGPVHVPGTRNTQQAIASTGPRQWLSNRQRCL